MRVRARQHSLQNRPMHACHRSCVLVCACSTLAHLEERECLPHHAPTAKQQYRPRSVLRNPRTPYRLAWKSVSVCSTTSSQLPNTLRLVAILLHKDKWHSRVR